jgi:hypothetical protein
MRYSPFGIAAAVAISACATSTGILPAGPNTYTVTEVLAPVRGGGAKAEQVALNEANTFCQQKGRVFVPNAMQQAGSLRNPFGPTGYSVTFRCLLSDDPAVATFRLEPTPDLILEQRNR